MPLLWKNHHISSYDEKKGYLLENKYFWDLLLNSKHGITNDDTVPGQGFTHASELRYWVSAHPHIIFLR